MDPDQEKEKKMEMIGTYISLPFVLLVPLMVGYWIGNALDRWLETKPYFLYAFLLFGLVAGAREFYRIVKKFGANG